MSYTRKYVGENHGGRPRPTPADLLAKHRAITARTHKPPMAETLASVTAFIQMKAGRDIDRHSLYWETAVEAWHTWDPERGAFITHLGWALRGARVRLARERRRHSYVTFPCEKDDDDDFQARRIQDLLAFGAPGFDAIRFRETINEKLASMPLGQALEMMLTKRPQSARKIAHRLGRDDDIDDIELIRKGLERAVAAGRALKIRSSEHRNIAYVRGDCAT